MLVLTVKNGKKIILILAKIIRKCVCGENVGDCWKRKTKAKKGRARRERGKLYIAKGNRSLKSKTCFPFVTLFLSSILFSYIIFQNTNKNRIIHIYIFLRLNNFGQLFEKST